jgi:uncharacterized DUF497 family protein
MPIVPNHFDPAKDAANQAKHGVSLGFGDEIVKDAAFIEISSFRPIDGEECFKVVGQVGGKLFTGVFVWRDGQRRFISVRRANDGEQRAYRYPG